MPGAQSLKERRYYAQSRNRFWQVMEGITGASASSAYEERIAGLKRKDIGLWDVLAECERDGSLDHRIRSEGPNDFEAFLKQYPRIRTLAFNGQKAAKSFDRLVRRKQTGVDWTAFHLLLLPSTSPANAAASKEALVEAWRLLLDYL